MDFKKLFNLFGADYSKKIENKIKNSKQKKEKLTFEKAVSFRERNGDWIKSKDVWHKNPSPNHELYHRTLRIKYNNKWHRGKFKPFPKEDYSDSDKKAPFFIVHAKSGRKMLVPRDKIYFTSKFIDVTNYKGNGDFDGIEKLHLYIIGDTEPFEKSILKT